MPTYTYQCQRETCGYLQDKMNKIAERDTHPPEFCDKCGNTELKRPESPQARGMGGTGFNFTDGGHNAEYSKTGPRPNPYGRKKR